VLGGKVMDPSDSLSDSLDISLGVVVFVEREREVARDGGGSNGNAKSIVWDAQ
jgi:hypothetical protein